VVPREMVLVSSLPATPSKAVQSTASHFINAILIIALSCHQDPSLYSPSPHQPPLSQNMTKQITNTLPIMRPPTRLGQCGTNINSLQLLAQRPLLLVRHRIRHHHLAQLAVIDHVQRVA
jgi:hypothetical protein